MHIKCLIMHTKKMKIVSSSTHPHAILNLYHVLLLNTKGDVRQNIMKRTAIIIFYNRSEWGLRLSSPVFKSDFSTVM